MSDLPVKHSRPELRALANEFYKTRSKEAADKIHALTPEEKSFLAGQDDFKHFIVALMFDAACGHDRVTRGQARAAQWFTKVLTPSGKEKKDRKVPQNVEVVDASE